MGKTQQLLRPFGAGYSAKVLGYGPIAYWPLWEATGSVAKCQVNSAQNGTYTGVTLGQSGIGDGKTCPRFDGVADYVDLYTAALVSAFNGGEFTLAIWAKMYNAAEWTDGAYNFCVVLRVDADNFVAIRKTPTNGQMEWIYKAGGTSKVVQKGSLSETDWMSLALTVSAVADEMKAYYYVGGAGGQEGGTLSGLGVWAGNLAADYCSLGIFNLGTLLHDFNGWLAHGALLPVLTPTQIADLAVV